MCNIHWWYLALCRLHVCTYIYKMYICIFCYAIHHKHTSHHPSLTPPCLDASTQPSPLFLCWPGWVPIDLLQTVWATWLLIRDHGTFPANLSAKLASHGFLTDLFHIRIYVYIYHRYIKYTNYIMYLIFCSYHIFLRLMFLLCFCCVRFPRETKNGRLLPSAWLSHR